MIYDRLNLDSIKKQIICIVVYLLVFHAYSQKAQYKFKNLSTSDGLSQSSVIAICQDKIGQMWLGTRDGLNKFDGTKFTAYRNNAQDSLSISNNDILSLIEDKEGFIWVGTFNGLNVYNPLTDNFKRFFRKKTSNSLKSNTVWCLQEVNDEIWIGTTNGLCIYNKKTKTFTNIQNSLESNHSPINDFITKIFISKAGYLWIGTNRRLYKLVSRNKNELSFKEFKLTGDGNNPLDYMVQDLIEAKNGNLMVATKTRGILEYIQDSDDISQLSNTHPLNSLKSTDFRAIAYDDKGNLWLGANDGVYVMNSRGKVQFTNVDENLSKIKSIYADSNGSMWIGSYYNGVHLWDVHNLNFSDLNYRQGNKSSYHNVVSSIEKDKNNHIYIGTEGGGITVLDSLHKKVSVINTQEYKELASDVIKSLRFLSASYLSVGTYGNGMSVLDIEKNKILSNYLPKELSNTIKKSSVYSIEKENDTVIWIGTFGEGLIRFNIEKKTYRVFKRKAKARNLLTSNRIRDILIDSQQRLWLGTQKGLNVFSLSNIEEGDWDIQHFFYDENINSGDDILTIYEDELKNIWIGTKAKGLYKFNGTSFDNIPIVNDENNVEIQSIHSILEDEHAFLWLSSNHGIAKYDPKKKNAIIYNQTDGLVDDEFNDNSALKMANHKLYFGGPRGISFFDPNKIEINQYSPQVILTDLKIKNRPLSIDKDGILKSHISYTKSITLEYDNANFSIGFSIPNFINSNNNLYSYRLAGLQDEWLTTSNNEATYTIQKSGTYTFEVKGANNDAIWNETSTKLKIIVNPAPWRTWWAFTIYFFLITTSLILLIRFLQSKSKLKHKLELEHLDNTRKEELNKTKIEFYTNISHEFRTPLTLILGPLQQILTDYTGSNTMHKKLLIIENNANHLLRLINRLMNFRKLESNQSKLQSAEGNIVKFLKEIYLSFTEHAKNGSFDYEFTTSNEEILVFYDRERLESVFYNLISNAFRYTPKGGQIKVVVEKEEVFLVVKIEDNGVGISEEYIDKIFDRFFEISIHNKPQENYNKGTGIGLAIAKNIVKLHKGKIEAENKPKGGAVFRVTLPLGRDHLSNDEIIANFKISDDVSRYTSQLQNSEIVLDESLEDFVFDDSKSTILIVEDNKPLRSFIKNLLKKDYNIIEAENGKIALKKAIESSPDLIVSDVVMPVMAGTELCSKIKETLKTSHIPVILLTSRSSLVYRLEGLESGADEYISKPFDLNEFKLRIKNILDSSSRLKNKFTQEDYLTPSEITVTSMDEKLLKRAFKIVEENMSNDQFDIPYFSSELGVSRTMLFTKIKAWTNVTPNEFIQSLRMKRAAQLLENSSLNISQICYNVGFKNPKYFSKCFSKKYGLTPKEYQDKFFNDHLKDLYD